MSSELTSNQVIEIKKFLLKHQREASIRFICQAFLKTSKCSEILNEMVELDKRRDELQTSVFLNNISEDVCLLMNFNIQSSSEHLITRMEVALSLFAIENIHQVQDNLTPLMMREISAILSP